MAHIQDIYSFGPFHSNRFRNFGYKEGCCSRRGPAFSVLLAVIVVLLSTAELKAQNLLTEVSAGANIPIYTNIAASHERTQSQLDQAYAFEYYIQEHGIVLGSEKGGHLSSAFRIVKPRDIRPHTRYFVESMARTPQVNASLGNYLSYTYKPYQQLKVNSVVQVYNSQLVIQKYTLTNTSDYKLTVDFYPFFQHQGGIRDVRLSSDSTYLTFKHDEPRDGWARRHNLSRPDSLYNVFMIGSKPRSFGVYPSLGPLRDEPTLPKVSLADTSLIEGGKVYLEDGSLCQKRQPEARMLAYHDSARSEILTQKAPQIDGDTLNIPGNGTQRLELSNFDSTLTAGDSFTVRFMCSRQQGEVTATIPENADSVGVELHLTSSAYVAPPDSVTMEVATDFGSVILHWKKRDGFSYYIYKGKASRPGYFRLVGDSLTTDSFHDLTVKEEVAQTYVIVARDSLGNFSVHSRQIQKPLAPPPPEPAPSFFTHVNDSSSLSNEIYPFLKSVAGFQRRFEIPAGSSVTLRVVRGKGWAHPDSLSRLVSQARDLMDHDFATGRSRAKSKYDNIPSISAELQEKRVYWSAFTQAYQGIMGPEKDVNHPYLVESRDPVHSWRSAGQTMYTALSLLSFVKMNSNLARKIHRNFFDHQDDNGFIPHRIGPRYTPDTLAGGERTAAAPWLSWISWNIYKEDPDRQFLSDAYQAGKSFYNFWINERDADNDSLSEWGGRPAIESIRDANSVIWDQVTEPDQVEALGLNSMLVMEARSLSKMAAELGDSSAARRWRQRAEHRAEKIRKLFWNESDQFFYHVDRDDHDFTISEKGDLRRREIIGFLPLWAGIATKSQARALVDYLESGGVFWRENGIPSLSAADEYYNPVGRWNGPVWVPWQYLVFRGLLKYDYHQKSGELVNRVTDAVSGQLSDVHTFKDRYGPDSDWAGSVNMSTSTSVIARMILEDTTKNLVSTRQQRQVPDDYRLSPNYPNPFNPTTRINYSVPKESKVTLTVYTITGRRVATLVEGRKKAGRHTVQFHARRLSSGVYIYRLSAGDFSQSRKMLLIK